MAMYKAKPKMSSDQKERANAAQKRKQEDADFNSYMYNLSPAQKKGRAKPNTDLGSSRTKMRGTVQERRKFEEARKKRVDYSNQQITKGAAAKAGAKASRAMREPQPLSPKDIAKGLGRKTPPSRRVGPGTPKQPSMPRRIGDLRDMGPRKPPARPMPKRIGGAAIPKPAQRPMPKRNPMLPTRIGRAVVPKAKKMGY
jgi:hypothetical protein